MYAFFYTDPRSPRAPAENFPGGGLNRYFWSNMGSNLKKLAVSAHLYGQNKKISPARGGGPGPTLPISAGAPGWRRGSYSADAALSSRLVHPVVRLLALLAKTQRFVCITWVALTHVMLHLTSRRLKINCSNCWDESFASACCASCSIDSNWNSSTVWSGFCMV